MPRATTMTGRQRDTGLNGPYYMNQAPVVGRLRSAASKPAPDLTRQSSITTNKPMPVDKAVTVTTVAATNLSQASTTGTKRKRAAATGLGSYWQTGVAEMGRGAKRQKRQINSEYDVLNGRQDQPPTTSWDASPDENGLLPNAGPGYKWAKPKATSSTQSDSSNDAAAPPSTETANTAAATVEQAASSTQSIASKDPDSLPSPETSDTIAPTVEQATSTTQSITSKDSNSSPPTETSNTAASTITQDRTIAEAPADDLPSGRNALSPVAGFKRKRKPDAAITAGINAKISELDPDDAVSAVLEPNEVRMYYESALLPLKRRKAQSPPKGHVRTPSTKVSTGPQLREAQRKQVESLRDRKAQLYPKHDLSKHQERARHREEGREALKRSLASCGIEYRGP